MLAAAHASLSPESRRLRYLAPKPRLSSAELAYLTEVDGVDHVAFVATRAGDPGRLAAVARFVRSAEDPESAEAAIVVADDLQGQGLGRRMGMVLADAARERGVRRFTALILSENVAAQRLFAAVSDRLSTSTEHGVRQLVAELAPAA
jgi:RimJ/RimL family protein N-acetyltransferase